MPEENVYSTLDRGSEFSQNSKFVSNKKKKTPIKVRVSTTPQPNIREFKQDSPEPKKLKKKKRTKLANYLVGTI